MAAKKKNDQENIGAVLKFLNFKNSIMIRDMNKGKVGKISKNSMRKYLVKNNIGRETSQSILCIGHFQGGDLNFFSATWKFREAELLYGFDIIDQ